MKNKILSFDESQKRDKRKRVVKYTLSTLLALTLAAGTVFTVLYFSKDSTVAIKKYDGSMSSQQESDDSWIENLPERDRKEAESLSEGDSGKPFEVKEEWKNGSVFSKEEFQAKRAEIIESSKSTDLYVSAMLLPSEEDGFTASEDDLVLEDGTFNVNYSYWTREVFVSETQHILNSLLNPDYGMWKDAQFGKTEAGQNVDYAFPFTMIFTTDYLRSMAEGKARPPIYADWNKNDYGRDDLNNSASRWYGEVVGSNIEFNYDEENYQYVAKATFNVKIGTKTINKEKIVKDGVLTLELVANPAGSRNINSKFKVLVNNGSLEVKE